MSTPETKTTISNFNEKLDELLSVLNIADEDKQTLRGEIDQFNDSKKFSFIEALNTQDMKDKFEELKEKDKQIIAFTTEHSKYFDAIMQSDDWRGLTKNLAKLQFYSIIKSIRIGGDKCDKIVDQFKLALDDKINVVNTLLVENIKEQTSQTGASTQATATASTRTKYATGIMDKIKNYAGYIKYKRKYIGLKFDNNLL